MSARWERFVVFGSALGANTAVVCAVYHISSSSACCCLSESRYFESDGHESGDPTISLLGKSHPCSSLVVRLGLLLNRIHQVHEAAVFSSQQLLRHLDIAQWLQ